MMRTITTAALLGTLTLTPDFLDDFAILVEPTCV